MRHLALTVIHDEHQALAAMLRSMSLLVAQAHREQHPPDFGVLRAMLFYVDEFPEKRHHPKESALLFPRLRLRCPQLAATLDQLDADHAHGEALIRLLEHALLAYEVLGESRRQDFVEALDRYVDGYLSHMAIEESEVLPAALAHFDAADWSALNEAFAANRDPLTGHAADDVYRPLFRKIVMSAPAPIGLG